MTALSGLFSKPWQRLRDTQLLRGRKLKQRLAWERGLTWFRLRYPHPSGATEVIKRLSCLDSVQRVALYHLSGDISKLYLGIPQAGTQVWPHIAGDEALTLSPAEPTLPDEPAVLHPSTSWSLDEEFVAHIVRGQLFITGAGDRSAATNAAYFPTPGDRKQAPWQLPAPNTGISTLANWAPWPPPEHLVATTNEPDKWVLGKAPDGRPLHVGGHINVYGSERHVSQWLTPVIIQAFAAEPQGLIILDGHGQLAHNLKRKPTITRRLKKDLLFVDMDSFSARGFNPMAALSSETAVATVTRWQRWFAGLGTQADSLALLPQAYEAGIRDMYQLRRWLLSQRGAHFAAVEAFDLVLEPLTAGSSELGAWLQQPATYFQGFPHHRSLIFSIKATTWERQHMLRAVLLAALSLPHSRLILYGFPIWDKVDTIQFTGHRNGRHDDAQQRIVSNGPPLKESTCVLVGCQPGTVPRLSERFLNGDRLLTENYHLLREGEGIIVSNSNITHTTWPGNSP